MDVNWICTALCMMSSNSNLVGPTGWEELRVNTYFCLKRSFSWNLSLFLSSLLSPGKVHVLVVVLFVISFSSMFCWASQHHDRVFPLLPPYVVNVWHWTPHTAKSLWSLCGCYVHWSLPYRLKVSWKCLWLLLLFKPLSHYFQCQPYCQFISQFYSGCLKLLVWRCSQGLQRYLLCLLTDKWGKHTQSNMDH